MNNEIEKLEKKLNRHSVGGRIGTAVWFLSIMSLFLAKPETEEAKQALFIIGTILFAGGALGLIINASKADKLFHQIDLMKIKEKSGQSR